MSTKGPTPHADPAGDGIQADARQSRSRLRGTAARLLGAQEAGLVIVILLLGLGLTLLGGEKDPPRTILLAPGDTFTSAPYEGVRHLSISEMLAQGRWSGEPQARWRVTVSRDDGRTAVHTSTRAPREEIRDDGRRSLIVREPTSSFLEARNLVLVAKNASFIAIMAVGMTAVIILAGIDLSVGSIFALAAIAGAMALNALHGIPALDPDSGQMVLPGAWPDIPGWAAVMIGLGVCAGVGALCGALNGAMIVGLRVHPFVITLGTMAALRGAAFLLPKKTMGTQSIGGFPPGFTRGFFKAELLGVNPVPVLFMLAVGGAGTLALSRLTIGRQIYAIGGNETAARYAGIPVGRVKLIVYTLCGLLAGLSACVDIGYGGAAQTGAGAGYELRVIAATVIGGASLAGGRGSAIGAVLGAILIELIGNGMVILEIDQDYNQVVMGAAIIVAVVIDQAKSRLSPGARAR